MGRFVSLCLKWENVFELTHTWAAVPHLNTRGQPRTDVTPDGFIFLNPDQIRPDCLETRMTSAAQLTHITGAY